MINTLKPSKTLGHDAERGEVLERISKEYGPPEEKQREATKKLGKDEFFKIMITQIQHQDPLKPYQNEQMAAQMAQFSSLEQMVNMNQNLDKLTQAQTPIHQLGAAGLIGKFVTSDSSRFIHAEGKPSELTFELPVDAAEAKITIVNEKGEGVKEFEVKELAAGTAKVKWDGKKSNSLEASAGSYSFTVEATTEFGKPIQAQTKKTSMVHGVSFDGKETVLLTGDIRNPQRMMLKNVSRIVDSSKGDGDLVSNSNMQNENQIANAINETAEDETPRIKGIDPNFMAVEAKDFRGEDEKRPMQPTTPVDLNDLSRDNPIGQALRNGETPIVQEDTDPSGMDSINPAARAMGMKHLSPEERQALMEESSLRNNLPSSENSSTAGKWVEE